MKTHARRWLHIWLAVFFAVQVPAAIALQFLAPDLFGRVWKTYLIFLSLYAVISTHWAGASSETPFSTEDQAHADRPGKGGGTMSEVAKETRETRETRPQPEPVETTETQTEVETTEKTTETTEKEA